MDENINISEDNPKTVEDIEIENFNIPLEKDEIAEAETDKEIKEIDLFDTADITVSKEEQEQIELEDILRNGKPILTKAMNEVIDRQNNAMKEEVGKHLENYEKRRNRREKREIFSVVARFGVLILFAFVIMTNTHLRTKMKNLISNSIELVNTIVSGEQATSNKLVDDFFGNDKKVIYYIQENETKNEDKSNTIQEVQQL